MFGERRRRSWLMRVPCALAGALLCTSLAAHAQSPLQQANIVERVGAAVPHGLVFTDSTGTPRTVGTFFDDRTPVVLELAYFSCPMLCPVVFDGLAGALAQSDLVLGRDVRVVTISIDPRDQTSTAAMWRAKAVGLLHAHDPFDWHVLTGREPEIDRLSRSVGFEFARDPETGEYAHAAAIVVLTPGGTVSRYLHGATFDPAELRTAVLAAANRTPTGAPPAPIERFLLRCFHYVPSLRRHAGAVTWFLRGGAAAVVLGIGGVLGLLWRRESRRAAR